MRKNSIVIAILFLLGVGGLLRADDKAESRKLYAEGLALEEKGDNEEAVRLFEAAALKDLHNVDAHLHYQRLLGKLNRFAFVEDYNTLSFDNPKDPIVQFLFGNALAHYGKFDKAKSYFEKALQLDKNSYYALNGLGAVAQMQEDAARARSYYDEALRINPDFTQAYINRGILYLNLGKKDPYQNREKLNKLALNDFNTALAIDPRDLQAHQARLSLYRETGDSKGILQAITDLVAVTPERPELFYERARIRLNDNDIENAMNDLTDALRLRGNYLDARLLRANLYLALRMPDDAFADFNLACKSSSTSAEPYLARGLANIALGKPAEALRDFDSAVSIDPKNPKAWVNRGSAYFRMQPKQLDKAIADFTQAITLDGRYFDAYQNRGSAYAAAGNYQAAVEDYQYAQRLEPSNQDVLARLDNCYAELEKNGKDFADERERVRRARLQELRAKVNDMALPQKTIFIMGLCKDIAENDDLPQSAMDILNELCKDPDWHVRCTAVKYLGGTMKKVCAPLLLPSLQDEERHVRGAAAMAVGRTMGTAAVPHLIPLLQDPDEYVRKEALRFLQELSGQDFPMTADKDWKAWWAIYQASHPETK